MEPARHPFPVSSTAPHYRRTKSESQEYFWTPVFSPSRRPVFYSRKKVGAVAAVIFARAQATTLETGARSHTDTGPCGRVFPRVLSHREPFACRASLWFRRDSPSGAYCCARKQCCSLKCSFRMTASSRNVKFSTSESRTLRSEGAPSAYSCIFGSTEAAGMISASSPSISRNCLAVTKPMVRPAFLVSRTQAICFISRLLGRRLSS